MGHIWHSIYWILHLSPKWNWLQQTTALRVVHSRMVRGVTCSRDWPSQAIIARLFSQVPTSLRPHLQPPFSPSYRDGHHCFIFFCQQPNSLKSFCQLFNHSYHCPSVQLLASFPCEWGQLSYHFPCQHFFIPIHYWHISKISQKWVCFSLAPSPTKQQSLLYLSSHLCLRI